MTWTSGMAVMLGQRYKPMQAPKLHQHTWLLHHAQSKTPAGYYRKMCNTQRTEQSFMAACLDQPWTANISWRSDTSFFYLSNKWLQRKRNISWLLTATSFSEALAMTADSRFHNQLPQIGLKCSRTCDHLGKCFTPLTPWIITPPISWVQHVPHSHTCSHVQCLWG